MGKHIVTGIVAHVDAGKTTLSEAMLYQSGKLRKFGRVDNGDAFLDPNVLEKKRGITIFSHQASLKYQDIDLTMLDTPGHIDFANQTEQVLRVLDYAILVVSAIDGVQGYTRTLWNLLKQYQIPTFIFINKMDNDGTDKKRILQELNTILIDSCIDFNELSEENIEKIAMQDDDVLDDYLNTGHLDDEIIKKMISERKIFPCYFGSALKMSGINELLSGLKKWTQEMVPQDEFGMKVFKVSHDEHGERLTWVRVTGGILKNKAVLLNDQKANQLRIYNGSKFELSKEIPTSGVCAITGLNDTYPGMGLGSEKNSSKPLIQPVLNYAVDIKDNDVHSVLIVLRQLEDEDPQLHVTWSKQLQQIRVQIMGAVQLEILQQLLEQRFNLKVAFIEGKILYKETIVKKVEGVGHFEPLRHYAEVHLLLEPGPRGSGLIFNSSCSLDVLSNNWQHQVITNLGSKEHLGVLIGAPITDMKITLVGGRASNVHSVGGDFKEATWRAVRQGLMMLKEDGCQLLEPWYRFRLTVEENQVGRAMNDIQKMSGNFETPENISGQVVLNGTAPVSEMQDYSQELRGYTHGQGQLECFIDGYRPCHDTEEIIQKEGYAPVSDLENTPDSVFCAHGAGYPVAWDEVPKMAHVPYEI